MDQNHLHDLETQCIQECAPDCVAACPMHVDVRTLCANVQQGNFTAALQLLRKTLPFTGIMCRVCEQPCRDVCLRHEAIAVADLERACVELGQSSEEKASSLTHRKQRVAIIGGGISGLTAAYDLAHKRYSVVIFESSSILGGRLRSTAENRLPRTTLEQEIDTFLKTGVEVHFNTAVSFTADSNRITLGQLHNDFDAVYVAVGAGHESVVDVIDPVTRSTALPGVFAGTDVGSQKELPFITAMSDGRIAAVSVDRYIQKVSLTASRVNEGPYESCLYTNTAGMQTLPVTRMRGNGYTAEEAIAEADRCFHCECMECVKDCEYLASYDGYPKKYVRQIYNNLSIVMGTRLFNKMINSCSLCGQCKEICPTHLDMGALCKEARQTMVEQNHMPPSAHDFALRDMAFSNSEHFSLTRNQPGTDSSQYVFFPGCQLSASAPEQVKQVYAYLRSHLPQVGLMLGCCGAPADWAGEREVFKSAMDQFVDHYEELGKPKVILACSSCYQVFKNNLPDIPIVSLWEVFDQNGLPESALSKKGGVVSIHDPCSTRHESQIHESVRRLTQKMGYRIEELPLNREKTACCSFGGQTWLVNPPLSQRIIDRRIHESPNDYLTYCAMCRDFFANHGKPTLHLLDLLFASDLQNRSERKGPGFSQRHENRARLKEQMLKEIWSENMPDHENYESIHLVISDEIKQLLEDRLILIEDLQKVIEYAERTQSKFLQQENGHYLAHYKPTRVTYWVDYSIDGDQYVIHNAYSHRMDLLEGMKS
jgi:Fe-S oxidoreductase